MNHVFMNFDGSLEPCLRFQQSFDMNHVVMDFEVKKYFSFCVIVLSYETETR